MTRSGGTSASTTCARGGFAHGLPAESSHGANAHFLNRFQYRIATDLDQVIGSLIHQFRFEGGTHGIYFQDRSCRGIVLAVNGAGFAAVQMASVASKGNQINHGISPQFDRFLTVAALIVVSHTLVVVARRGGPRRPRAK